jgi:hypothetical protein
LLPGAASLVPHLAADLVQGVGGSLDDVPRVKADLGVWAALCDRPRDPVGVSEEITRICCKRSSPIRFRNFSTVLRSRPKDAHTSRPV